MFPVLIYLFFSSMTVRIGEATDYTTTGVIHEKIALYENPRFGLDIVGFGDDSALYMTIFDPIRKEDNFSLSVVATRFNGVEFPIPQNPIALCELLDDEAANADTPLTQFHVSRVFSMEGVTCPIPAGTKRLMPYMFPPKISLQNNVGCGMFTYKTTIQKCQGQRPEDCVPFITASMHVFLGGDDCSDTLM